MRRPRLREESPDSWPPALSSSCHSPAALLAQMTARTALNTRQPHEALYSVPGPSLPGGAPDSTQDRLGGGAQLSVESIRLVLSEGLLSVILRGLVTWGMLPLPFINFPSSVSERCAVFQGGLLGFGPVGGVVRSSCSSQESRAPPDMCVPRPRGL